MTDNNNDNELAATQRMFEAAERLNKELWGFAVDSEGMSVLDFKLIVERETGLPVRFFEAHVENSHVIGCFVRKNDGIYIYVSSNLGPSEKRFVEVKELCQAVLDIQADWSTDGSRTLESLANPLPFGADYNTNRPWFSEKLAELLAGELLYPIETRRKDLIQLSDGAVQESDLVDRLRIPRHRVRYLLSDSIVTWSQKWWDHLFGRDRKDS